MTAIKAGNSPLVISNKYSLDTLRLTLILTKFYCLNTLLPHSSVTVLLIPP